MHQNLNQPRDREQKPQANTIWTQSSKGFILPFTGFYRLLWFGSVYFEQTRYTHTNSSRLFKKNSFNSQFLKNNTLAFGPLCKFRLNLQTVTGSNLRCFIAVVDSCFRKEHPSTCWHASSIEQTTKMVKKKTELVKQATLSLSSIFSSPVWGMLQIVISRVQRKKGTKRSHVLSFSGAFSHQWHTKFARHVQAPQTTRNCFISF